MPMHLPSIRALHAFESAARLLSFTQAAAELSLTQSAVSRRIHELESGLGERLFHREGKSLRLSAAGRAYLPFARDALERLRAGHEALARKHRPRILTVSVSPNFSARWLVPRLGRFLDAHPEVDLRIGAAQRHVDFASDDVDLAVRHGVGEWPGLHVVRLCEESVFPACSPGLLRGGPALREPRDLRRHVMPRPVDSLAGPRAGGSVFAGRSHCRTARAHARPLVYHQQRPVVVHRRRVEPLPESLNAIGSAPLEYTNWMSASVMLMSAPTSNSSVEVRKPPMPSDSASSRMVPPTLV